MASVAEVLFLTTFLPLYRGKSVGDAQLIAVSADILLV